VPERQDIDDALSRLAADLGGGAVDSEYEFWKAPSLLEEIKSGDLSLGSLLSPHEAEEFKALLSGLIGLFVTRHVGVERARRQLNLVHKFIFPQKFEVPWTVVESLSKKYESGHLLRAWALRRLMYELADLVELKLPELEDVTAGRVVLAPGADEGHRLYPLVLRLINRSTTLQSLAVDVYLELIQRENESGTVDERSLRRDLKRLQAWEDADPVHTRLKKEYAAAGARYHWKARIPVRFYSESFRPSTPTELAESALNASDSEEGPESIK
jgi:hypothetical protein